MGKKVVTAMQPFTKVGTTTEIPTEEANRVATMEVITTLRSVAMVTCNGLKNEEKTRRAPPLFWVHRDVRASLHVRPWVLVGREPQVEAWAQGGWRGPRSELNGGVSAAAAVGGDAGREEHHEGAAVERSVVSGSKELRGRCWKKQNGFRLGVPLELTIEKLGPHFSSIKIGLSTLLGVRMDTFMVLTSSVYPCAVGEGLLHVSLWQNNEGKPMVKHMKAQLAVITLDTTIYVAAALKTDGGLAARESKEEGVTRTEHRLSHAIVSNKVFEVHDGSRRLAFYSSAAMMEEQVTLLTMMRFWVLVGGHHVLGVAMLRSKEPPGLNLALGQVRNNKEFNWALWWYYDTTQDL